MAWCYAIMATIDDTTLREYLRLQRKKAPPCIDEYDMFWLQLCTFFELRSAAEDFFVKHRYLARSRSGALPLPWVEIKRVLDNGGPPEQPITRIAKANFADVDELIRNLRKVLSRVREKVNIGRVQQVDAQCLRWLTRQPGRNAIEKAGSKQEILGVVRVENYNTLENRVLKDFMERCFSLASKYLRDNENIHNGRWKGHATLKMVSRFRNLCSAGLSLEVMGSVRSLAEMPQPNYVLQQDRLYSKIWKAYCVLLRQEDVAEKLWGRRGEVDELYNKCTGGVAKHCSPRAKYHTNIWFNEIDGRKHLVENPCWENELALADIVEPELPRDEVCIVDFAAVWDDRTELIYPKDHPNAYPYIKNSHRPSLDAVAEVASLQNILLNNDDQKLKDYLRSYYGLIGGKEWIVLTPDNWSSEWIDKVVRARPAALLSSRVFMLWRSIAAVLGSDFGLRRNGKTVMVHDCFQFPFVNHCLIKYVRGGVENGNGATLPQRASKILHGENCQEGERRFWLREKHGDGKLDQELSHVGDEHLHVGLGSPEENRHNILVRGAMRYVEARDQGVVCYYDELDPLWLVVQNRAEEVEFKVLIEHNECHPGGKEYVGERIHGGRLQMSSRKVSLNLLWGHQSDTAKLKQVEQDLDEPIERDTDMHFEARVTPGQGLATIMFTAAFIKEPRPIELQNMKDTDLTKARIEREMKRHFPPVMPYVEASREAWDIILPALRDYARTGKLIDNGLFAKAQSYWGVVNPSARASSGMRRYGVFRQFDPATMSPIDRLKRENVFGNNPSNRYPDPDVKYDKLFKWLASKYQADQRVLRLIAWTYQYDCQDFESIREKLHHQYVELCGSLDGAAISFCSNNFAIGDGRVGDMLKVALDHVSNGSCALDELRLLYNLMQFNPNALAMCGSELCEKAFDVFVVMFNDHRQFYNRNRSATAYCWAGQAATQRVGYIIKCLLFILHRRRFDQSFLKEPHGWVSVRRAGANGEVETMLEPPGLLNEPLPVQHRFSEVLNCEVDEYGPKTTLPGHEEMRKSFIKYVNGEGKIEGIPLGDGG